MMTSVPGGWSCLRFRAVAPYMAGLVTNLVGSCGVRIF